MLIGTHLLKQPHIHSISLKKQLKSRHIWQDTGRFPSVWDTAVHCSCPPQGFPGEETWELAPWPLPPREPHLGKCVGNGRPGLSLPPGSVWKCRCSFALWVINQGSSQLYDDCLDGSAKTRPNFIKRWEVVSTMAKSLALECGLYHSLALGLWTTDLCSLGPKPQVPHP